MNINLDNSIDTLEVRVRQMLAEIDRLRSINMELAMALEGITRDLPLKRDWLDPELERFAKTAIQRARGAA